MTELPSDFWHKVNNSDALFDALVAALEYALPLAALALEEHRIERLRCGHNFGTKRIGLYDHEVDELERHRAALKAARDEP
jgi:hypothetical protein